MFSVNAASKELLRSQVMRGGEAAAAVSVDLNGEREFTLEVGDAGDGINSDQANWADAKVTLTDGREILLGDLPIAGTELPRRASWSLPFSFRYAGAELMEEGFSITVPKASGDALIVYARENGSK